MHKNILSFRLFVVNCFGSLYFKICFDFSCICCGKRLWEPCCFVGLVLYCCRIMCSFLKSGFKREKCLYHTRRSVAHFICKVSTCSLKRMYLFHKPVAVLRKVGKKGSLPLQSVATSLPTSCCSFSFTKLNRISHTWTRSGLLTAIFIGEGTLVHPPRRVIWSSSTSLIWTGWLPNWYFYLYSHIHALLMKFTHPVYQTVYTVLLLLSHWARYWIKFQSAKDIQFIVY